MRLITVGTGTAAPHPERVQSATWIEWEGARVLIDCGGGVVWRMASLGLPWADITHVAITHFHADHTNDLANLLFAWRYGVLPPRTAPVTLVGPPGLAELVQRMRAAFGDSLVDPPPEIAVLELPPGAELELPSGGRLASQKVPHTNESVAYSLAVAGKRVVISGDTGFDARLGEWAAGADVFLCECSLPDALAIPTHLTPRQCGALGAIARPTLLALTHFYPPVEDEDLLAQVLELYDGPVVRCHDGWMHDLRGN